MSLHVIYAPLMGISLCSLVLLGDSLRILGAEIVIDITKHAVLGKFNDVRPGIYKEYMKVWGATGDLEEVYRVSWQRGRRWI